RSSLHLYCEAFGLQALPAAFRTWPERSERFEIGLLGPTPFLVPTPQIGKDAFELGPFLTARRAKQQHFAMLARQPAEGGREVDAEVAAESLERVADQLAVAPRPRRDRPLRERFRFVGHDAGGIEVDHRAESLTLPARTVRRVEREG